ncbi:conserved Plasmodium protein, unknown function [Plasmodium knowlesi strain H]|uniref:Cilia- and flagella-associated protein 251 n=3 Tax=Plasmodium knowlesi TaxID=5850 RepID=A0A5K1URY5_PLAKH|nr:WD repeat-containing protein 66, putative [Plasmodium knowlesi strain H]OTN67466.1 Uncharacterized protein PKNOH_S06404800 [Plasmodium knowlesi]CAA9987323.1 WD repeat-containing protein 66, putative [Plasmodium knowlesi strain H]SBO23397.1 conserved Plasmodium protein, unknown function [Plasmodium knowlesi strain H]SBO24648.1 conserved Plasmodium protein, unknown function [Plasmodium knowlesi strain H]VVS76797.1 WD repeat-containing protein 66, putative [Plasmodium knowlesi strain H]|eukprot:XP_002258327.1 hypothetical protein, conserved in Plasmodium species [Plasmodium knowlesi strain H]
MQNEGTLDEPITLKFCYGINESLSSVHVIRKPKQEGDTTQEHGDPLIVYTSDNNIVIVDEKEQLLFRGHVNKISKLIKSYNNEFIVSCDKGKDSFIILWRLNQNALLPVKKFFFHSSHEPSGKSEYKKDMDGEEFNRNDSSCLVNSPLGGTQEGVTSGHGNIAEVGNVGYECVDISFDNRYICALTEKQPYVKGNQRSTQGESIHHNNNGRSSMNAVFYQEIVIFDTNGGEDNIVCKDKIYGKETQEKIRFNKKYEIISNSKSKLYIYNFAKKHRTITHYSPSLYKSNIINERFIFTETSFVDNSTMLLTGTTNGYLIVWDYSSIFLSKTKQTVKQREYQKYLEIRKDIPINIVQSYGHFVILGLSDGSVQVFDTNLKCYAWFENIHVGQIKSISFEMSNFEEDFFSWNSFIIFTEKNVIKQIHPNSFNNVGNTTQWDDNYGDQHGVGGKHIPGEVPIASGAKNTLNEPPQTENKLLLHFDSSCISCICTNPTSEKNVIYIGNENGLIEIFDFDKNVKVQSICLTSKEIVSILFSNSGNILCVGCKCGFIQMITADNLKTFFSSRDMKYQVTYLYFSEDDKILIASSANANMIIYKNDNCDNPFDWKFAYRIVNTNNITLTDLKIVKEIHKKNYYIIVGITDNRYMIFYHYNFLENNVIISYLPIEQIYVPTCLSQNLSFYDRQILCICNEASKIRFFDLETKKIVKTVHLPFREKNVKKFLPLRGYGGNDTLTADGKNKSTEPDKHNLEKNNIFLFVLNENMIVFTQTPIDANCFRYIGVIVSSGAIQNVISKNENIFILSNNKIFYYHINANVLKKNIEVQSNTLQNFIEQIGGKTSNMYREIMDSFYYCEIQKKKFQQKKEKHDIKKLLNILSIEYIFASINVFLSKFEIQNIIQEYHFYYKYVLPLLMESGAPVAESLSMADGITLVNYKSDDDLLLQNLFFVRPPGCTDTQEHSDKDALSESCAGINSSQRKRRDKSDDDKKDEDNQSEANPSGTENTLDGDITKDCEHIYFNINAFIYTYFNFATEEETNLEQVIQNIGSYYKDSNKKKKISCSDFFEMLENYGETMDQNEFQRIFQIFTKSEEFLNGSDIFDLDLLKDLLT